VEEAGGAAERHRREPARRRLQAVLAAQRRELDERDDERDEVHGSDSALEQEPGDGVVGRREEGQVGHLDEDDRAGLSDP